MKTKLSTPSQGSGPLILGLVVLLAAGLIAIVNTAGSDVAARKPNPLRDKTASTFAPLVDRRVSL